VEIELAIFLLIRFHQNFFTLSITIFSIKGHYLGIALTHPHPGEPPTPTISIWYQPPV
jgi:hypothetical protein